METKTSVYIPPKLKEQIIRLAELSDRSLSAEIVHLIKLQLPKELSRMEKVLENGQ